MEILREVSGETGVLLWQAYRNVMFWASAEPAERAALFAADAGKRRLDDLLNADVPGDIVDALVTVGRLVGAPESTPGDAVAEACRTISGWAEDQGYDATALAFTQAAALASPRSAKLALAVGKLARGRGELPRAETWYRHAIMIARQIGDWETYGRAYVALGNMARQRGNFPVSYRMHIKALRSGKRKGIGAIVGESSHELFVISTEMGRTEHAEHFARQAVRSYGPTHDLLPALAHDIAYSWMEQGHFARALPVFEALEPLFPDVKRKLPVRANIVRAAGAVGNRDLFRKMLNETLKLTREPEALPAVADALLEMARGAASLGEWDRAEQMAERAVAMAQDRGEAAVMVRAESLLGSIRSGRSVERAIAARAGRGSDQADALANEMVRSLETRALERV